jgi:3-deoxy-D-manno-octulosonic-acid transferase
VIYAPWDFSVSVRAYLKAIKPILYITAETEIWPNIFYALHRRHIPLAQINGRISDKSYPRYKAVSWIVRHILSYVNCFCMQTTADADRICAIGADKNKVFVAGNMKFDDQFSGKTRAYGQIFSRDYGPVFVAGSTHPGEEEIVLDVFKKLRAQFADLSLILAPRHVERVADVEALVRATGFSYELFSNVIRSGQKANDIILVDTIGHLRDLYSYATVVFVGKSLTIKGGHNIIEPAYFEKPILVGPHMQNFQDIAQIFLERQALIQVQDEEELVCRVEELLNDEAQCEEMGYRAREIIEQQQGAGDKIMNIILGILR